ncbi:hypothetical protein PQG02_24850 [Nostoc sp. UHCC 0926]|nr:hypothetical protein [Nostoc sp. UHCC 0926]WDD31881.1 hypothetical protein PQG02_24850 [Nostoc sp. UHCC 0926]
MHADQIAPSQALIISNLQIEFRMLYKGENSSGAGCSADDQQSKPVKTPN